MEEECHQYRRHNRHTAGIQNPSSKKDENLLQVNYFKAKGRGVIKGMDKYKAEYTNEYGEGINIYFSLINEEVELFKKMNRP